MALLPIVRYAICGVEGRSGWFKRDTSDMEYLSMTALRQKGAKMRNPSKQALPVPTRAARPTPTYHDEVSEDFIARQQAHIEGKMPANFQLTPVSGDAW